MKVRLDWRRGAQENAAAYYERAKGLARKEQGARQAMEETRALIAKAGKELEVAVSSEIGPKMRRRKEWFEKFRWFFTSKGRLVVAGRDARQNDLLVSKVMTDEDLFFHADIQGAPATILVAGRKADSREKSEAAQFAASHSSAWKTGAASVDVYCVERGQLSKHAQGGFTGAGGFAIEGQREWFRATPLGLAVGEKEGVVLCLPAVHPEAEKMRFSISLGAREKGEAAAIIAKSLAASPDEVILALPSGKFSLKEKR